MDGQLNLFDYMNEQEPQILPEYSVRLFFLDGFSYVYEYDKPYVGMWDKEIAQHGIIVDYNIIRGGMNPTLKTPCFRHCDVEWCSLSCFLKRGYIRHDGKWVRNDKGEILISKTKECDWTPRER